MPRSARCPATGVFGLQSPTTSGASDTLSTQVGSLAAEAETAEAFCAPATLRRYEASRRARVEAVSDAVRRAANRFYEKDADALNAASPTGVTGSNNKESSVRSSVRGAFEAHPIVCTPL